MKELIGKMVSVDFNIESWRLPFSGDAKVLAVDMPMIKLQGRHSRECDAVWINVSQIKMIKEA